MRAVLARCIEIHIHDMYIHKIFHNETVIVKIKINALR